MGSVTTVVTPPVYEPVSVEEAKGWLRITDSSHDAIVRSLIKTFRERAENLTLRAFIPRTLKLHLCEWPCDDQWGYKIELPAAPAWTLTSFKYTDLDGVLQDMPAADYEFHSEAEPGFIIPAYLATWPAIRLVPDAIQVTWVAGYAPGSPGDEAGYQSALPEAVKTWMQVQIAALEQNRAAVIGGTILSDLPRGLGDGILDSLVMGRRLF